MSKKYPSIIYVASVLRYDPDSGFLYWKTRSIDHFTSSRSMKIWNSRYAEKKAGWASEGYVVITLRPYGNIGAHRIAWLLTYGRWPENELDHINHHRSDNRIRNLREATASKNRRNLTGRSDNTSGCLGVTWDKSRNKWKAGIHINGKFIHIGRYKDKEQAISSRKVAEKHYGFHKNHGR